MSRSTESTGRRPLPRSARLDFSVRANLSSLRAPLDAKSAFSKKIWVFARPAWIGSRQPHR
jgi:hypothetical protein